MPERTPLYELETEVGAVFAEDAGWLLPAHYGDPAAEYRHAREGTVVFDRSHHGQIELAGPDARSFLNNLSTNDIKNLAPGTCCEAFLCNAQARVLAFVWIACLPSGDGKESFWLDAGPGQAGRVVKHLDRYLISEQVEIIDRTSECAQLHLAGPQAASVVKFIRTGLESERVDLQPLEVIGTPFGHLRRRDLLGTMGYDLVCNKDQVSAFWQSLLTASVRPAGLDALEMLRIEAGVPVYGKDVSEDNLAPEVGRTRQAISYTKGCYLGQEPIVRIRDLGHVNRTLLGLKIAGEGMVPPGAKLFRDGKEVGYVTSSAISPRFGTIALGYVRRGNEPGTVLEVEVAGSRRNAEVTGLPFSTGGAGVG